MATTVHQVKHVNGGVWEGDFLGYRARVVDVSFDAAGYNHDTGEVLTPKQLGWDTIEAIIVLEHPWDVFNHDTLMLVPESFTPALEGRAGEWALRLYASHDTDTYIGFQHNPEVPDTYDVQNLGARIVVIGA